MVVSGRAVCLLDLQHTVLEAVRGFSSEQKARLDELDRDGHGRLRVLAIMMDPVIR